MNTQAKEVVMMDKTLLLRALVLLVALAVAALAVVPEAAAQGAAVHGTVKDSSGRAVASVWVAFEKDGAERGKSLTGDDGKYYVGGLASGRYQVTVRRGDRVLFTGSATVPVNGAFDIRLR